MSEFKIIKYEAKGLLLQISGHEVDGVGKEARNNLAFFRVEENLKSVLILTGVSRFVLGKNRRCSGKIG